MVEIGELISKIEEASADATVETASTKKPQNAEGAAKQPIPKVASAIGSMPEYKLKEDWADYSERLDQYFVANGVLEDERKVALLVTLIGTKAYEVLKDICHPALPGELAYEELCATLRRHFGKKVCSFKERIEFFDMKQYEDETVSQWFRRIKKKARLCDFKGRVEETVKDKFVTGMRKGAVLDRLWEEGDETSLEELYDIAVKREAAAKDRVPQVIKALQELNWFLALFSLLMLMWRYKERGVIVLYVILYFLYLIIV